jgi:hypothetical protein
MGLATCDGGGAERDEEKGPGDGTGVRIAMHSPGNCIDRAQFGSGVGNRRGERGRHRRRPVASASSATLRRVSARYGEQVPRPAWWGGYRVAPSMFEFWQGRPNRLHDRLRYAKQGSGWVRERLAP